MTNFEYVRSMSIDKLASFLALQMDAGEYHDGPICDERECTSNPEWRHPGVCVQCIKRWLETDEVRD